MHLLFFVTTASSILGTDLAGHLAWHLANLPDSQMTHGQIQIIWPSIIPYNKEYWHASGELGMPWSVFEYLI
ncbi:hypothetical protein B0H11DRAFT_2232076 [Mycena galericulata]|nr:hypothetical protein B0H11DRAFT_2232076 [Mycena galericulata]